MNLHDIFTFGKYKGLTLKEVYQGTANLNRDLVKKYLINTVDSELKIINSVVTVGDFTSSVIEDSKISISETVEMKLKDTESYKNKKHLTEIMNFEIEDTYLKGVTIHKNLGNDWTESIEKLFSNRNNLMEISLGYMSFNDFNTKVYSSGKEKTEIAEGDPQYISWCIENIDKFYVDVDDFDELQKLEVYKFIGIEITHRIEDAYYYKLKISRSIRSYSTKIIGLNACKQVDDFFEENQRNLEFEYNRPSYGKYNGYNGWSDDVIDDAFEGDPENTWNVD